MNHYKLSLILGLILIGATSGCDAEYSPNVYSPGGMQQANKVERAIIQNVREVDVNDPSLGLGTGVGAAAGGIVGSQIGKGGGNAAAVLGGVLIGGAIGWLIEQDAKATTAYEYILEKQNGDLITLAQKQEQPFAVGDHVFIMYGVKARVIPDTSKIKPSLGKSEK